MNKKGTNPVKSILVISAFWLMSLAYAQTTTEFNSINATGNITLPNGFIGIGTANPSDRLHIVATGNLLVSNFACGGAYAGIGFSTTLTGCSTYSLLGEASSTYVNAPSGGFVSFRIANSEKFRMSSTGNLGINNTGPNATLEIMSGNPLGALSVRDNTGTSLLFVNGSSGAVLISGASVHTSTTTIPIANTSGEFPQNRMSITIPIGNTTGTLYDNRLGFTVGSLPVANTTGEFPQNRMSITIPIGNTTGTLYDKRLGFTVGRVP